MLWYFRWTKNLFNFKICTLQKNCKVEKKSVVCLGITGTIFPLNLDIVFFLVFFSLDFWFFFFMKNYLLYCLQHFILKDANQNLILKQRIRKSFIYACYRCLDGIKTPSTIRRNIEIGTTFIFYLFPLESKCHVGCHFCFYSLLCLRT